MLRRYLRLKQTPLLVPKQPITPTMQKVCRSPIHGRPFYDLIILFLFSFLFNLSTLFLCIVSAIFSYLSLSAFAARLSLSLVIFSYCNVSHPRSNLKIPYLDRRPSSFSCLLQASETYKLLSLLLLLHLLLLRLRCRKRDALSLTLLIRVIAHFGTEGGFEWFPWLSYISISTKSRFPSRLWVFRTGLAHSEWCLGDWRRLSGWGCGGGGHGWIFSFRSVGLKLHSKS